MPGVCSSGHGHLKALVVSEKSIAFVRAHSNRAPDYSAGVNHSLPTYGYARQYSGVNLASYIKHITSSELTQEGLRNVSGAVMQLATVEELEAHKRAVSIRMDHIQSKS